jgi:phosphoglycolate phosphatase
MGILIFDLDGTLINTSKIVISAYTRVFRHFPDLLVPTEDVMLGTFGLPEEKIWEVLMPNCPEATRHEAHSLSGIYVQEGLVKSDVLMDGSRAVLDELKKRGHTLTVASNCGTKYLNEILDSQGIRQYFTSPLCLESVSGYKKADILAKHILHFGKSGCVMIGDRNTDIEAAIYHGIPAIGCDFGFGNTNELREANQVINDICDLLLIFH